MTPPADRWYRHFWPWFLVALLASSVAGSLVSAYLALRYPEVIFERADEPVQSPSRDGHGDG